MKMLANSLIKQEISCAGGMPIYKIKTEHNDAEWQRICASFNSLSPDQYFKYGADESISPTRERRYRVVNAVIDTDRKTWLQCDVSDNNVFTQNVDDARKEPRIFELMETEVVNSHFLKVLMLQTAAYVDHYLKYQGKVVPLTIGIHQVRNIALPGLETSNSPEGIHQDGTNIVLPAYVFNRHNIKGGTSTVYDLDKNILEAITLQNGECLIHSDSHYFHHVSPISSADGLREGYRDIIGFDVAFQQ